MDRQFMGAVVLLTVLLVIGAWLGWIPPQEASDTDDTWPATYTMDFDAGTQDQLGDEWARDADVPDDPNRNGTVEWDITPTNRVAASGNYSGMYLIDGLQDDGTIWLHRSIPVAPGQRYQVNVSASAFSESESFNVVAHMVQYAGLSAPQREEDFPGPDTVDETGASAGLRQPLARAAGWEPYGFSWTTPVIEQGNSTVHVAVGLSVVWETRIGFPYDDITVSIAPVGDAAEEATPD